MIVLAIDTCDSRGSVGLFRNDEVCALVAHDTSEEYSSWLLAAVDRALAQTGLRMAEVDAYAAAAGPGSFTGVRVGLTTVKAWAEVYGKSVAAVSRLEAIAVQGHGRTEYVAAFTDAQRAQVFGAIYKRNGLGLNRIGDEMVIAPGKFVEKVVEVAGAEKIAWFSTDLDCLVNEEAWKRREKLGESLESVPAVLAPAIARIAFGQLAAGRFTDALGLDANYVRRSDAEIFWKGAAHGH